MARAPDGSSGSPPPELAAPPLPWVPWDRHTHQPPVAGLQAAEDHQGRPRLWRRPGGPLGPIPLIPLLRFRSRSREFHRAFFCLTHTCVFFASKLPMRLRPGWVLDRWLIFPRHRARESAPPPPWRARRPLAASLGTAPTARCFPSTPPTLNLPTPTPSVRHEETCVLQGSVFCGDWGSPQHFGQFQFLARRWLSCIFS